MWESKKKKINVRWNDMCGGGKGERERERERITGGLEMTGRRGGGEEGNETRQEMWRSCNDEGKQARKNKITR